MTPAALKPSASNARLTLDKGMNAAAAAALVLAGAGQAAALADPVRIDAVLAWLSVLVHAFAG